MVRSRSLPPPHRENTRASADLIEIDLRVGPDVQLWNLCLSSLSCASPPDDNAGCTHTNDALPGAKPGRCVFDPLHGVRWDQLRSYRRILATDGERRGSDLQYRGRALGREQVLGIGDGVGRRRLDRTVSACVRVYRQTRPARPGWAPWRHCLPSGAARRTCGLRRRRPDCSRALELVSGRFSDGTQYIVDKASDERLQVQHPA